MKIRLPNRNGEEVYIEDKQSIVLIGANGSGKTRMSVWIDENNPGMNIHRISAQKSLNMPTMVSPTEIEAAEEKFLYGGSNENKSWLKDQGKRMQRWGQKPEIHLLNDYEMLMEYLMTENYQKSIEFRENHKQGNKEFDNQTRLEQIRSIWENVITHRKLKICAGKIEVFDNEDTEEVRRYYNGSEMSDGERAIFYFIGEVLCVPSNSLIIIDEPENHLHKSILIRLWNAIELARKDCTFLYITHSLEFSSSRINSKIVWLKGLNSNMQWNYELISDGDATDNLRLEILGNRQKVILVEGNPERSIDRKLYALLFPEYNLIPVDNCNSVIQYTKAYQSLSGIHYAEVKGIIDRDRRSDEEIDLLKQKNIFTPKVAEIENLFLLPEVIQIICEKQSKVEYESILQSVQERTFEFMSREISAQALLFSKQKCQNEINKIINKKTNTIDEYKESILSISNTVNVDSIYDECVQELNLIVANKDYLRALKVVNNKGLLSFTQLPNTFGWKKDYYINYVLTLLNLKDETSRELKSAFRTYISLDESTTS